MNTEALLICSIYQYHEGLLLDSSTSHHMCPHRSWFSTYQAIDDGTILMGTNVSS